MKRGFTLIESIVLIALMAIALLALVNLFIIFSKMTGYQQTVMAVRGSSSSAMSAFQAAVLPAKQVAASHSFSGTVYASSASVLVVEVPAIDSSGTVIIGTSDYVAFYASAGTLYRRIEAGAGSARLSGVKVLSTTLHLLSFTYEGNDVTKSPSVTVDIVTQGAYKQETVTSNLREQLYLRNFQPI